MRFLEWERIYEIEPVEQRSVLARAPVSAATQIRGSVARTRRPTAPVCPEGIGQPGSVVHPAAAGRSRHVLVDARPPSLRAHTMPCRHPAPYVPASTPRSADVLLYLDLDGVVHHEKVLWHPGKGIHMSPHEAAGHTLFEWLPILEEALAPYPTVALVLSSTWCIRPGYGATLKRFPTSLRSRFIGGTYHKRVHGVDPWNQSMFRRTPRGVQVQEDAQRRRPRHWIALDDDLEDWPQAFRSHLVACEGTTGLSDPKVQWELKDQLQRCHEAL